MTVLEVIQRSSEFLARKGVDSARLQSELLLAHVLSVPRMRLYLDFERQLSAAEEERIRDFVQRRGRREPLQHIVGSACFCGVDIAINRDALIPRPETELLVEHGLEFISSFNGAGPLVLDFGTGSGCLAIVLALKCSAAQIYALDSSAAALDLARQNAERHGLAGRISFLHGESLAAVPRELRFDLLVTNPPYIPTGEIQTLQPEVRDYDPRLALDGGPDGLDFYRRFATEAGNRLKPGGKMLLEFGDGQAEMIRSIMQAGDWIVEGIFPDYNGRPRLLRASPRLSPKSKV